MTCLTHLSNTLFVVVVFLIIILIIIIIINKNDLYFVVNVARGKHAYQSSRLKKYGPATKAVDGVTTNSLSTIIHTNIDKPNTWWEVDLNHAYFIHDVRIYFRTDCK